MSRPVEHQVLMGGAMSSPPTAELPQPHYWAECAAAECPWSLDMGEESVPLPDLQDMHDEFVRSGHER